MKTFSTRYAVLLAILLIALILRLYKINGPVLDWHSFRQADTASVTREYVKHSIDLLHPRYQDLGSIQSGMDNLEGYRMVEFPILNATVAVIVKAFPLFSLEVVHRLISIVFSLGTLVTLFFLTKEFSGTKVAYVTAFIFAVLPYNVFYSRTILPEPTQLFLFCFSLLAFWNWLTTKDFRWWLGSLLCVSLALLLKPFTIFFFPIFAAMAYVKQQKKLFKNIFLYIFVVLSLLPLAWWRSWIQQFPSGIPVNHWLFNSDTNNVPAWIASNPVFNALNTAFGYNPDGLRYGPAWMRWLGYERLTKLILGYTGIILLPVALYKVKSKEWWLYGSWWLGVILYFVVIARGNVQHDYYQVIIIPILCMTVARGAVMMATFLSKKFTGLLGVGVTAALVLLSLVLSGEQIKGFYNNNHPEYIVAGKAVDQKTPAEAKVIAPAFGDTMFLYQTNRTGWPMNLDIDSKIKLGATHYVTTSYDDEARELEKRFFTIEKTPEYLLLDLTRPTQEKP